VRCSSHRGTGGLDGWSPSTESGLQACYGKSPGDGAFSIKVLLVSPEGNIHGVHALRAPADVGWNRVARMLDGEAFRFTFATRRFPDR
jgi:hypothetical protein